MRKPSMYSRIFLGYMSAPGVPTSCRSVMVLSSESTKFLDKNFQRCPVLLFLRFLQQVNDEDARWDQAKARESAHRAGVRVAVG